MGERTVLVVEDSGPTAEVLCEVLRDEHVATAWTRDGAQALSYLATEPPPCLILLDLFMPAPSGFDVLTALHADPRLRDVPVVITSAADARTMARARAAPRGRGHAEAVRHRPAGRAHPALPGVSHR